MGFLDKPITADISAKPILSIERTMTWQMAYSSGARASDDWNICVGEVQLTAGNKHEVHLMLKRLATEAAEAVKWIEGTSE